MFERFLRRSCETERLDRGEYTAAEYQRWQNEMWYVHRLFGEARALRRSLLKVVDIKAKRSIKVLDVGAGSGDLLRLTGTWLGDNQPFLVGIDQSFSSALSIGGNGREPLVGNALALPFANRSFDLAISTLTLHHFSDEAAISLLKEMRRVARDSVIVVDLHRHPIAYYFYRIFGWFFLQKFTWEDGSLSILRSFKPKELHALAIEAGFVEANVNRSAAYRLVLTGR